MMFAHLLAAVVATSPGLPDPTLDVVKLRQEFEQAAERDPTQWDRCAELFTEMHRRFERADPLAPEVLLYAASCQEAGGRAGPALETYRQIYATYPDAPQGQLAFRGVARCELALLNFERAADARERYASRWPDEFTSLIFLSEAATLRSGLGQESRAKADLDRLEAAPAMQSRAGEIFWSRRELLPTSYASAKARRAHAEEYIKRFGTRDLRPYLLAIATIGELDWQASCKLKRPGPLGLCVELEHDTPSLCDRPVTRVVVHARDRKRADAAEAAFTRVVAAVQRMAPDELASDPRLRDVAGMAAVRLADRELEGLLDVHMPGDLAFHVDEWRRDSTASGDRARYDKQVAKKADSTRRFTQFYKDKTQLAATVERKYRAVIEQRLSLAGGLAAVARLGLVLLDFGDELMQGDVDLPPGPEARRAYCEALDERAEPILGRGFEALSLCLTRASMIGVFDESARFCEDELRRRAPLAFPPLRELFAAGQALDPEPEIIGLQAEPYGFGEQ